MYSLTVESSRYCSNKCTYDITVTRWPKYVFSFTKEGQCISIVPKMNFKSQHTKDMIVNSVWAAAFKNYQENTGETKMTKLGQLYKVKDSEDVYGTFLTTDSQGRFVLEMKGSEAIKAFAEDSLEAVRPYTVAIKFTGPGGSTGYHYIATAGQVEKGDIVIIGGSLAEVVALDTKSEEAVERLEGRKIVTQPL